MSEPRRSGDVEVLREILHRALVRYLTVRPGGFELQPGERLRPVVEARILGHGGARTFYQDKKPVCRSLDGLRPVTGDKDRTCVECTARQRCTAQVRVDLIVERWPFRLLLAYSSARAFLGYEAELRQRRVEIEHVITKITVVDRRTWGELRFSSVR
ncbi:MAG: hypothetical protein IPK26_30220 [Planctomycetes bacterium]|nr:hypothetical protein [Planctomycetota bacterium]